MTMSSAVSAPTMRPVLARTSSAASGLRFCGMIEEPVVNLSESAHEAEERRRPDHDLLGEARQMHGADRRGRQASPARSRGRRRRRANSPSAGRSRAPSPSSRRSIGKEVPASAAAPSGDSLSRAPRIGEAAAVARDHLDIGEQVMAEGDRLRGLQMREARHHGRGMLQRLLGERALVGARARRRSRRSRRAPRAGSRSRPGRCASARCAAARPPAPISSASRASTFMWMSSSARVNVNLPASISDRIVSRPRAILRRIVARQ